MRKGMLYAPGMIRNQGNERPRLHIPIVCGRNLLFLSRCCPRRVTIISALPFAVLSFGSPDRDQSVTSRN